MNDTVKLYGVSNGVETYLGEFPAQIAPEIKMKEIIHSYFGEIDEEIGNDGAMALWAMKEFLDWYKKGTLNE